MLDTNRTFISYVHIAFIISLIVLYAVWVKNNDVKIDALLLSASGVLLFAVAFLGAGKRLKCEVECAEPLQFHPAERKHLALLAAACIVWVAIVELILFAAACKLHPGSSALDAVRQHLYSNLDVRHYINIAENGYRNTPDDNRYMIVFLPLYPVILQGLTILSKDLVLVGLVYNAVAAFVVTLLFYKLCLLDFDSRTALKSSLFMLLFPSSFFLLVPMTESTFVALMVMYFYLLKRNKFTIGLFAVGMLAGLTRSTSVTLLLPAAIEFFVSVRTHRKTVRRTVSEAIALCGVPFGLFVYMLINYRVYGTFTQFMLFQREHWNQRLHFFWNTISYTLGYYSTDAAKLSENWYTLFLPNLIALFAALILTALCARKFRASYTYFALAYISMAFGVTWLLSGPRYATALITTYMALAYLSKTRTVYAVLCAVSLVGLVVYFTMFMNGKQIY